MVIFLFWEKKSRKIICKFWYKYFVNWRGSLVERLVLTDCLDSVLVCLLSLILLLFWNRLTGLTLGGSHGLIILTQKTFPEIDKRPLSCNFHDSGSLNSISRCNCKSNKKWTVSGGWHFTSRMPRWQCGTTTSTDSSLWRMWSGIAPTVWLSVQAPVDVSPEDVRYFSLHTSFFLIQFK